MSRRRCVIVAGFPRSGTSWVAKCLSFARGFTYYREPDNHHFVPGAEERFANLYLTATHDDLAYRAHMTRAAAGEIATSRTLRQNPGPLLAPFGRYGRDLGERFPALFLRKPHVLLKLVYANLNLAWLSANLPEARQLCLLRHPCGTFESWLRLGWEPRPEELLENERLVADHLTPYVDLIRSAETFWERAGALWAATALVLHRQTPSEGERTVVAYEWLCVDPVARFEDLYRQLDLTWSARAAKFIRSSDSEDDQRTYSMTRPTARQADKWKERLSADDVSACRRFVEPFGLPYYPDFDIQVSPGATA